MFSFCYMFRHFAMTMSKNYENKLSRLLWEE